MRRLTRGRSLILVTLLLAGALTLAATASNTVPQTYAAAQAQGIDTGDLAPAEHGIDFWPDVIGDPVQG